MFAPHRYVPTRAGIVNLYEYDDQVFELAGGRLLLRGHNTSGKTKALELLLPFCLDGDISPRKLDPFAKSAKEMKWNLVGCVESEQRVGYAWLEFARLGADGGREYVTAGIGLKANRGREGVRRWFFVLPGRRVGHDLPLRRGDYPLTRTDLAAALGSEERLLDSPAEYRRRLNEVLYGFPSQEQYTTMVSLMLELRRPHLSKGLDHRAVTRLLSSSLPEVDHDLMRRLGEGLEQLEELQAALRRVEQARERLESFHRSAYRAYARAALAERGDELRAADTAHERASAERRAAESARADVAARAGALAAALEQARAARHDAEGERDALLGSAEWASVADVEQLGETAKRAGDAARAAAERHADALRRLATDEAEATAAAAGLAEEAAQRAEIGEALAAAAAGAGLAARHAVLAEQLGDDARDPVRWGELARVEADAWLEVLAEHERRLDALAAAEERLERARLVGEHAAGRRRLAAERRAELADWLEGARDALTDAVETWAAGLGELPLRQPELEAALTAALDAGGEEAPSPGAAWAAVAAQRAEALVSERTAIAARAAAIERERSERGEERRRLVAEEDEPPPVPHTREAVREGRPGAPLWRLVEFAPEVTPKAQAGLEAALEGAGLLDAWVTPAGEALDPETLDVVLAPADGADAAGHSLRGALQPAAGGSVGTSAVESILAAIAVTPGAPGPALSCAVSRRGHFRVGIAEGRWTKGQADYIGATARAARRARRVAELDVELASLSEAATRLAEERVTIEERLARLAAEQQAFPSTDEVTRLRRGVILAEREERGLEREVVELERATRAASGDRDEQRAACGRHAERHVLPADVDRPGVRVRREHALGYRAHIGPAVRAARAERAARARTADLDARVAAAGTAGTTLATAAAHAVGDARRLAAEHREREATLGAGGGALRERKRVVDAAAVAARAEVDRLTAEDKHTAMHVERTQGALEEAERAHSGMRVRREAALVRFRGLERSDLFVLALEEAAPADHARADGWTLTRALEVLRAIPAERLHAGAPLGALANRVQRACGELDRALALLGDLNVLTQTDGDGLIAVRIADGGRERTLAALMSALREEIAQRERTLSAEQRRVFNDTLLEEIAEHLRARIGRVEELVGDMNATLAACPTGSGRTVQLDWRAREEDSGELRTVTRLLRRSVATLAEAEREPLIAFFRERIQAGREAAGLADAGGATAAGGTAAHLRAAFDYRDWFEFGLIEVRDGQRTRLTARRHAVGSGGEQAVLVHMPLFAAAAALYASSGDGRAPRLVMLDEALSGIDDDTREKVMAVLVALDLDVVMTSHELWGTYRTVPALAIYQLHRDNDLFGVAAERFLWDGELLREGEQAALPS